MSLSLLRFIAEQWLADIELYSRLVVGRPLYAYQLAPARAIVDSVLNERGLEFAVMFPRQSGKNETQAQVTAYLLNVFQHTPGAQIVQAQPTFKPQAQNAVRRLEQALRNDWNKGLWKRGPEYLVRLGEALCTFYSADPQANVVGATASLLLMCDEAQAVLRSVWERSFVPMTVSTNATIVLWGTAWTSHTLLAGALRHLHGLEARDGKQRVFVATHDDVARENPRFARAVRKHVARLGRQHPHVKTQYFNEELEAEGGLFPPDRRARMQGTHPPLAGPRPLPASEQAGAPPGQPYFHTYALLLDVGGEDQIGQQLTLFGKDGDLDDLPPAGSRFDGRRDATALTVVEVDLSTLADPALSAPTYRAVHRRQWVGAAQRQLHGQLCALFEHWRAAYLIVDSTGLGEGLASSLTAALPTGVVQALKFTAERKSKLGWGFVAVCDAGRWREWTLGAGDWGLEAGIDSSVPAASGQPADADLQQLFWRQLAHTQYEIRPGPAHSLAWGVPDSTRDPVTGGTLHDDLVISAALCADLDRLDWRVPTGPGVILHGADPLVELSQGF